MLILYSPSQQPAGHLNYELCIRKDHPYFSCTDPLHFISAIAQAQGSSFPSTQRISAVCPRDRLHSTPRWSCYKPSSQHLWPHHCVQLSYSGQVTQNKFGCWCNGIFEAENKYFSSSTNCSIICVREIRGFLQVLII